MRDVLLAIAGGLVGLMIAGLANLVILPRVLEQQRRAFDRDGSDAALIRMLFMDVASMARYTTFTYRFIIPALLATVLAIGAVTQFGTD
jgi:hypothetical protein